MQRRTIIIGLVILIGGIGWYLFRPERLVINVTVNEQFPVTVGAASPVGLTPSSRAVSRTPLPLSSISTTCRLTSGNRPLAW